MDARTKTTLATFLTAARIVVGMKTPLRSTGSAS